MHPNTFYHITQIPSHSSLHSLQPPSKQQPPPAYSRDPRTLPAHQPNIHSQHQSFTLIPTSRYKLAPPIMIICGLPPVGQRQGKLGKLGKGTLLTKVDIKSNFRLLPVHPAGRHLLAMNWNTQIFIIPFGLSSTPKLFNLLADFLS